MTKIFQATDALEAKWAECERPNIAAAIEIAGGFLVKGNAWCVYRSIDDNQIYRHHFRFESGKIVDIQWEKLT